MASISGSTRKLPSGRWQARYWDDDGVQHSKTFVRKGDANRYLRETILSLERGDWHDPTKASVHYRVIVDAWRKSWEVKPSTRDRQNGILRKYLLPEFGDLPLSAIDQKRIQDWVWRLRDDGRLSPYTIKRMFGVLRVSLKFAVRRGVLKANPAVGIKLPKVDAREMPILTHEQVSAVAEQVPRRYRMLVRTAAYSGMRFGELAALRVKRIDWQAGTLRVVQTVGVAGGQTVFGTPKSKNGIRTVALPDHLMTELREHVPDNADPDALVFPDADGGPLRSSNFRPRVWRPAVVEALPAHLHHVRFHDLRHTCASWLLAAGINPLIVSRQLGHSSAAFTMDTYGHLMPDAHEQVQAAMAAAYVA